MLLAVGGSLWFIWDFFFSGRRALQREPRVTRGQKGLGKNVLCHVISHILYTRVSEGEVAGSALGYPAAVIPKSESPVCV